VAPDFSNQLHDWNLGITPYPEGVFWTQFVDPDHVQHLDADDGSGRWAITRDVPDYKSFANSLGGVPPVPGRASFDIRWTGGGSPYSARDTTNRFVIDGRTVNATIRWRANSEGFHFRSDFQATSLFAAVVRERNGVFFS
jgi:hypothetical protein